MPGILVIPRLRLPPAALDGKTTGLNKSLYQMYQQNIFPIKYINRVGWTWSGPNHLGPNRFRVESSGTSLTL